MCTSRRVLPLVGLSVLVLVAASASASTIKGYNAFLSSNSDMLYVPLLGSTSGTLGTDLGGGLAVGKQSDSFTLSGIGATTAGNVSFELSWTLPAPWQENTAFVQLTVQDMDFATMSLPGASLIETMELTILADPGDAPGAPNLIVTGANYGNYRPDGAGNCQGTVTYTFNLMTDLNVSLAEMQAVSDWPAPAPPSGDMDFGLFVKLTSKIDRIQAGSGNYHNTIETFEGALGYEPDPGPEPATMALLALGVPLVMRRRRR